ncbi:MAG TPA: cytochrome c1 [Xanthomonadaceae bacterium]|jgi:ubiquinol-cytochrome c reductase cytochrome c1 subunit|nr:cytochrome c1 [Xanthomonadaceae bacterium]
MTKRLSFFAIVLAAAAALAPLAASAEEGPELQEANTHLTDQASLQRGAKLFMNYCSGCHSIKFMRYSRIGDDLGLTEKEVTDNLNFTGAKYLDHINVSMKPEDATAWLGKVPPDLSLEGRLRGPDWIYTYLKSFYMDESRPSGWNNTLLPNASMPNVLWQLQGIQHPVTEPKKKDAQGHAEICALGDYDGQCIKDLAVADGQKGQLTPEEYDQAARDISAFLQYVGEPAAMQREAYGVWVILFLAFFSFLAYLLKHEYWRDVH